MRPAPPSKDDTSAGLSAQTVAFLVETVPERVIGTLIFGAIAINIANVVGRYLFLAPIIWAEEAMIYIMIWCVFLGAVHVTWRGRHLRMDLFANALGVRWRRRLEVLATLWIAATCAFVIPQSFEVVATMIRFGQRSVVLELPMAIPHAAPLAGFALMLVAVLARLRWRLGGDAGTDDPPLEY